MFRMPAVLLVVGLCVAHASAEPKMLDVGGHKLFLDCKGSVGKQTVVLMAGGGRPASDWSIVQPKVAKFARVCSYDRAGLGKSEGDPQVGQSADVIVDELHKLLAASGEKMPVVLVAHSIAGLYARRYATKFPLEITGFVMVDSSHEEQALKNSEVFGNPLDAAEAARQGLITKPGQRLAWKTDKPMIVIAHGKLQNAPYGISESQMVVWENTWQAYQKDLASRSSQGELRIAETSGHGIMFDQPEMIVEAIRDLLAKA